MSKLKATLGEIVYFKKFKQGSAPNYPEATAGGHAIGILLGVVPPRTPDPSPRQQKQLMGSVGILTFDDVAAFLGEEASALCLKKYEEKYYPTEAEKNQPPPTPSPQLNLVDASGAPLRVDEQKPQ